MMQGPPDYRLISQGTESLGHELTTLSCMPSGRAAFFFFFYYMFHVKHLEKGGGMMHKVDVFLCAAVSYLGSLFGKIDQLIIALICAMAIDYLSGIIAAYKCKKLSSKKGVQGFCKKAAILLIVGVGAILDTWVLPGKSLLRNTICIYYIATEALSVIENCAAIGVKVPQKLLDALEQIKKDS